MSGKRTKGIDSILYKAEKGALLSTGALQHDAWYQIESKAATGSIFDELIIGSIFKSNSAGTQTLATGDSVYPLNLTEVCKVDAEVNAEMGTLDATDSCDYPYSVNIPDGFSTISGSISSMLKFDENTNELQPVTKDFLGNFFQLVEDNNDGTYQVSGGENDQMILMMVLDRSVKTAGKTETWFVCPIYLTSIGLTLSLKELNTTSYEWTKGDGGASFYSRLLA
jgi:hypothetical protein